MGVGFAVARFLLSGAASLLACMTGTAMTQEESACCRSMHGKCGGMEKMGCCRTEVRTDDHPQLASSAPTLALPTVVVIQCLSVVAPMPTIPQALLPTSITPPRTADWANDRPPNLIRSLIQ